MQPQLVLYVRVVPYDYARNAKPRSGSKTYLSLRKKRDDKQSSREKKNFHKRHSFTYRKLLPFLPLIKLYK